MTFKGIFSIFVCDCVGAHTVDAVVDWPTEILYLHAMADYIVQVIHNCM